MRSTSMDKRARFNLIWRRPMFMFTVFLLACLMSLAQDAQPKDGRYYESLARQAYEKKDYEAFLENMKVAAAMRPHHPRLMYNLAVAYALSGHPAEALQWLGQMTLMGLVFSAEKE